MDNPQPTTNNLQRHHRRGFTLVETLVAASIFIMLTTIAVGVFVQALKSQRYLTALMAVNSGASTVLEQVIREVRTGYEFCPGSTPPNPCNETGDSVSFTNYAGRPTTIEWRPGGGGTTGGIYRTNSSVTYRLTGEDVDITAARFAVTQTVGATASACFPWRVTIALTARPRDPALADRTVVLQTTVTARTLPVEVPTAGQWVLDNCQLDD